MKECMLECLKKNTACKNMLCRQWINYEEDKNCTLIAIGKNGNMTLREVAERLGVSFVRVKQIEDKLLKKLSKGILKLSK